VVWLCANNRVDEAEKIIRNAAKMNGIDMPEHILTVKTEADKNTSGSIKDVPERDGEPTIKDGSQATKSSNSILAKFRNLKKSANKEDVNHKARYELMDIFRNRRLTIYAVSMAFLW
jgi:hypothetical protein